jgi:hypothetical protein
MRPDAPTNRPAAGLRPLPTRHVVAEDGPHPARELMPRPTGPSRLGSRCRATRVPDRTGKPGIERTTTVTFTPPLSWSPRALAAKSALLEHA